MTRTDDAALRRMHFHALDRQQQEQAIRRLAVAGQGDHSIAHATGWAVEAVRQVIADGVDFRTRNSLQSVVG